MIKFALAFALVPSSPSIAFAPITPQFTTRTTTTTTSHPIRAPHQTILQNNNNNNANNEIWYDSSSLKPTPPRRPILAGNWKLNPTSHPEAISLLKLLRGNFIHHDRIQDTNAEVVIFPPFPFLSTAIDLLEGTGIKVGAQTIGLESKGAFTGEVSASMVRSLGCDYAMVGHSERRSLYEETDDVVNRKVRLCLEQPNLHVILCVGETLEEYENELLETVITMQVKKGLRDISGEDVSDRITIAYEPVWAIGTGKVATPEQAQIAHVVTRRVLRIMYGYDVANSVRIQYGGSVSPESVQSLMDMPDVDGALVGGASLDADSFTRIVDGAVHVAQQTTTQGGATTSSRPQEFTARECVSCKNTLGESPVWSQRDQTLYWISAPDQECWAWDLVNPPFRRLFDSILGCVAVQAGPVGSVVLAGERMFLSADMSRVDPGDTASAGGVRDLCPRPEQSLPTRPNDGRVDRQGRMVFGMYNNYHRAGSSIGENCAGLYRLNNENLGVEQILPYQYRVSNCICFSPEGETMYFCDTPTRKVYAFDYPVSGNGPVSNRRLLWTVPADLPGGPDGAQVDAEGHVWVSLSGAGKVVRIDPTSGAVTMVVNLPVKCPTSVTFGGRDLDEMFITTRGPDGGGLYRLKMPNGIKGLPEPELAAVREDI